MAVHDVVIRKRRTELCRLPRIGPDGFHADAENVALRRQQLRGGLIEPGPMRSIVANVENPRTGAAVDVAQKSIPFFKTGKQLRDRLNEGA